MFYFINVIDYSKYMLILNLVPETRFNQVGTEATKC